MSEWREIHGDQNLRMANKMLEQQGEINDLRAERDAAVSELAAARSGCVVAGEALRRVRERALLAGDAATVTIAEHALRAEKWEAPLWVCAVCSWTSSESEPCPEHGHTGEVWCCDGCKAAVEQAAEAVSVQ